MFFYTSNRIIHKNITIKPLREMENIEECLVQVAEWIEKKWGYLRNNPGVEYRVESLRKDIADIYIATYAGLPIGVFGLKNFNAPENSIELWFFYVDESFRHLGVGSYMLDKVKSLCADEGLKRIKFDTLTPTLNRFYKKNGADELGDGRLLEAPTTIMQIDIAPLPRPA
jgi:GNAT superfamily N-acetyltransferase